MKGDILLVKYKYDPISYIIRFITHSEWNHVAWFLDKDNIIEAKARDIGRTSARRYIYQKKYKCKIVRLKHISKKDLKKAMNYIITEQKHSTWLQWVECLILIWFDYNKPLPSKTCSGFIAEALAKVGFYFNQHKQPCKISPEDINNSKRTKNVKNNRI